MTQLQCPETPSECGTIGSRGMWSHLHNKHGWDKDEAIQWVRSRKSGDSDDDPGSGTSEPPHDEGEKNTETPENPPNQGESEFQFDGDPEDPQRSPEEDEGSPLEADSEAIVVQEEGSEKLSPENFDSRNRPEMDPPEGSNLPDDVTPEDFEAGEQDHRNASPDDRDEQHDDAGERDASEDDDGGVLSKIKDRVSDDESDEEPQSHTEEIVEEASDPDERERRQRVLNALNGDDDETEKREETPESRPNQGKSDNENRQSHSDPSPKPAQMQNGMVVDENLLQTLFGLPFDQAANVTGWEGWRLSPEEKEANARLLRAWADEQDIDLGPGVMLAMSLGSTVGGRAVGYTRYRKQQTSDDTASTDPDGSPDTPPESDRQPSDPRETESTPSGATPETDAQQDEQFNFDQPIGQRTPAEA